MAILKNNLSVEMENGGSYTVVADQRDYAQWEMQPFWGEERSSVRIRFLAFAALRRTKQIKTTWDTFDAECVEVVVARTESAENVDPTQSDQSDED